MSHYERRNCYRCGRRKPIGEFEPDPSRPKRGVVNNCITCANRKLSPLAHKTKAVKRQPATVTCRWCGVQFTVSKERRRYCCHTHRLLWEAEEARIRRWDRAASKAEGVA